MAEYDGFYQPGDSILTPSGIQAIVREVQEWEQTFVVYLDKGPDCTPLRWLVAILRKGEGSFFDPPGDDVNRKRFLKVSGTPQGDKDVSVL